MPTGTGKTVVLASVINDYLKEAEHEDNQVLIVAHRIEIINQIREMIKKFNLVNELEEGRIRVESIQRLARKTDLKKLFPCEKGKTFIPTLCIIDEAHHAQARSYKKLWKWWENAKFLGMTATPCRLKAEGFDDLFDKLICSWDVMEFIDKGWLAMFDYYTVKANGDLISNVRSLSERGVDGDYQIAEMGSVMDNRASIGQLYTAYKEYARGKQGIVYAINKEHAAHIKEYYEEMGEIVALVDSDTPAKERAQIDQDYKDSKIKILVNCEIYGEGYDVPFVEFIQLARPTLSLSKYLQQVGRGMRPNKGKENVVILDCVGHCYLFGLPSDKRDWQRMFREGQNTDNGGWLPKPGTREYRMMELQTRGYIDYSDGHDHEMQKVLGMDGLQREINVSRNITHADSMPIKDDVMGNLQKMSHIDRIIKHVGGHYLVSGVLQHKEQNFIVDDTGAVVFRSPGITTITERGFVVCGSNRIHDLVTGEDYKAQIQSPKVLGNIEFIFQSDSKESYWSPRVYGGNSVGFYSLHSNEKYFLQQSTRGTQVYVLIHRSLPLYMFFVEGVMDNGEFLLHEPHSNVQFVMSSNGQLTPLKRLSIPKSIAKVYTSFTDSNNCEVLREQLDAIDRIIIPEINITDMMHIDSIVKETPNYILVKGYQDSDFDKLSDFVVDSQGKVIYNISNSSEDIELREEGIVIQKKRFRDLTTDSYYNGRYIGIEDFGPCKFVCYSKNGDRQIYTPRIRGCKNVLFTKIEWNGMFVMDWVVDPKETYVKVHNLMLIHKSMPDTCFHALGWIKSTGKYVLADNVTEEVYALNPFGQLTRIEYPGSLDYQPFQYSTIAKSEETIAVEKLRKILHSKLSFSK